MLVVCWCMLEVCWLYIGDNLGKANCMIRVYLGYVEGMLWTFVVF